MAEIVGAIGVPHTPFYPSLVEREGPESRTAQLFRKMMAALEAMRADLIVLIDTDHLNTFFFDNLPVFAIGVTDVFHGPNDEPRSVPAYAHTLAAGRGSTHPHGGGPGRLRHGDVAALHRGSLGDRSAAFHDAEDAGAGHPGVRRGPHSAAASARRCFELGMAIREALLQLAAAPARRAIGSGSFSLEVFGPRMRQASLTACRTRPGPSASAHCSSRAKSTA